MKNFFDHQVRIFDEKLIKFERKVQPMVHPHCFQVETLNKIFKVS